MTMDRPSFRAGKGSKVLRFHPEDGARVVTTPCLDKAPPWTAAMWIQREADTESATLLSSSSFALKLEQWPDRHTIGVTRVGQFDLSSDCEAPRGAWVHLIFVGTERDTRVYIDGQHQATFEQAISLPLRWIGSTLGERDFGAFLLDELQIFHEALNAAQILELYQRPPEDEPVLEVQIDGEIGASGASGGSKELRSAGHGSPRAVRVQFKNTGKGSLSYSLRAIDAAGAPVTPSESDKTVEPGGPPTREVTFKPSKAGSVSATLTITRARNTRL